MCRYEVILYVQKLRELEEGDVDLHIPKELRAARVAAVHIISYIEYYSICRIELQGENGAIPKKEQKTLSCSLGLGGRSWRDSSVGRALDI
jgi:hypothetical protein